MNQLSELADILTNTGPYAGFVIDSNNSDDVTKYVGVVDLDTGEVIRDVQAANITTGQMLRTTQSPEGLLGWAVEQRARIAALTVPDAKGVQYVATDRGGYECHEIWPGKISE
jgi:hypothetical protein